jgi:serine-type D-Ala-D-Ala carboxypeptidase (penicillin-binding protein 5/6)
VIAHKRILHLLIAVVLLACTSGSALAAQAYVIVDSRTGHVLQERNMRDKRQVGSLTKVATAMVVLDWAEKHNGDLNQLATVPPEAFVGTGNNNLELQAGDTITLRDALYAALVQSDDISAVTLAHHVGGALQGLVPSAGTPVATFVGQMNALARGLKMERTRFSNPTGQDAGVKPTPHSTAADMARLTRYAMAKASFRFYVSQKERQISFNRGGNQQNYMLRNTNELLGTDGIDGVKTGRTARAGDCLILSAQRQSEIIKQGEGATVIPRHLIVVLLGSPNRFPQGQQMLSLGWQLHDQWAAGGRMVDPKKTL